MFLSHQNFSQTPWRKLQCMASALAEESTSHNCDFSHCDAKFIVAASWSLLSGAPGVV